MIETIPSALDGERVDRVIALMLGCSRVQAVALLDSGAVRIDGEVVQQRSRRMRLGEQIETPEVDLSPPIPVADPSVEFTVVHADEHVIVIDKPAGLVVHPSYKNAAGTLINGVLERAKTWPAGSRPSLLGRLDKYTSGVVIVAKRPAVHAALQRAMDARRIDKDYAAIVWGRPSPMRGTIDLALDRDPWDRRRITVTDRGGQPSVTKYERLAVSSLGPPRPFSLVRCRLITGRTHQIRVHLSARDWPIVGDAVYGLKRTGGSPTPLDEVALAFPRQALHAWRLSLRQPTTNAALEITAPLPDDMQQLATALCLSTVALA